ncbi:MULTISPECIES: bifunctional 2-polyprenyl-6-hydroxyphenol methylase/3-demethylubiquinol 3-O-methyltransferase UbiG [Aliiglaciecola]|uniref:bifunctional 2-polyprenyl-6-hydroxyphenol methylase/3-demethylubiquinol 3-O-methyltransferase UbiG n=1 Tax=Aliiglaciecola TaxID=1406885 RepID=UPI001C08D606|nr:MULTISPECIES: bifunctional 2-polyprenyl-6-hydroxyphenol methylase/3-demethylubiquinol 3-O-methyltransferase UbiG [Aliiglaciecola]MBU2876417.1 bifunctional 2-polyprenyl-6-hydroxyphenol methylase/3-demethylubiquinol 3-O-methyltransferase UbiG [Aliiglaciecola lipolytica]MDO6712735.1 bifunctional 2-polyprenyl-6-hydroxyphenol methylase/3-demethylubiquinol 3-O-methyltransferase UbiG [Aliiglaciecola sp. 2_MG-2023]MDO6753866.1 bifunctional 2-polyprenyl-6-hydroxyphenol methylase/3-demethylubiquinol 3-
MTNQNVDAAEIDKFSALASRWWDLEGEFKPLHEINPLRADYIQQRTNGVFDKSIIDVGCGGGILSEYLAKQGAQVSGIDMASESLEVARLHGLESGVKVSYQQITAEQMAEQHANQFDIVTCLEMLEHVPDPASIVRACATLVKPGGDVFFSTLNRNLKSYLMAIVGAEKVLNLVPKGTHEYEKFIQPSELLSWVDSTDLITKHMTGLHMNPFSKQYYLSEQNVDVNYIVHCQKSEV